jgi:ketosteroid isomerase-like protein
MMEREELLRRAYAAFNARDIDGALALMQPDVDWPNAIEGRREHGHAAVREYWTRQFEQIDSHVDPERITEDEDGRLIVDVHQVVRDRTGALLTDGRVQHVYTFRGDLVERMDIREP